MEHQSTITSVSWSDIRKKVHKINSRLAKEIDKINPGEDLPLYLAKYRYGDIILDAGNINIPRPQADAGFSKKDVIKDLSYTFVPMGLVMNQNVEIFSDESDMLFCVNNIETGNFMGLWEVFDSADTYYIKSIWNISSGSRSVFFLKKFGVRTVHVPIMRNLNINYPVPREPALQWHMLREIANCADFDTEWYSQILYFPQKWIDLILHDPDWRDLKIMLLETCWDQIKYWRNKITFDTVWDIFTANLRRKNIKYHDYSYNTAKHLILVALGVFPGFKLVDENSGGGPFVALQNILLEYFNRASKGNYYPSMVQPAYFQHQPGSNVYLSLGIISWVCDNPKTISSQGKISAIPGMISIIEEFIKEVSRGHYQMEGTFLDKLCENTEFTFFHMDSTDTLSAGDIHSSKEIPKIDEHMALNAHLNEGYTWPYAGAFVRNCVRISYK